MQETDLNIVCFVGAERQLFLYVEAKTFFFFFYSPKFIPSH